MILGELEGENPPVPPCGDVERNVDGSGPAEGPSPAIPVDEGILPTGAARRRGRERPFPAEVRIDSRGIKPKARTATVHGFHSGEAVEIPTSLSCNLCPLYHVKRKEKRHPLACPEGRKNQICPILTRRQIDWATGLIEEVRGATGRDPSASDRARIEQVVRFRSRLFQVENYLKVAGLIDLREGEVRAVADRLGGIESGLTRSLGELRQSMAEGREARRPPAPRLDEYLAAVARNVAAPLAIEGESCKEVLSEATTKEEEAPGP